MGRPEGVLPASIAELHADTWTLPFWQATAEHRLVCARCTACGAFRMPPSPFCPVCRSQALEWVELSGRGVVFTFTIIRRAVTPSVRDHVPYVVAVVDLEGAPGARLISNVIGPDAESVVIGAPVHVVWDDAAEGVTVPRFALGPAAQPPRAGTS